MIMRLWSLMIDETLRLDKGTAIDSGAYHVYLAKAHFFSCNLIHVQFDEISY